MKARIFNSLRLILELHLQRSLWFEQGNCISFKEVKMFHWQNRLFQEIKRQADIRLPIRSIHSAIYIHNKSM